MYNSWCSCGTMDNPLIQYLNRPELVVKVQEFFGINYNNNDDKKKDRESEEDHIKDPVPGITVTNKFWYYLFIIGTELGDETFYACFIPFWFWNVDGVVGRRFVLVWATLMYLGQALKDIMCCPRPPPPVIKLQSKWAAEFGLPSTHAMVGVSIPFSILLYTHERYEYLRT